MRVERVIAGGMSCRTAAERFGGERGQRGEVRRLARPPSPNADLRERGRRQHHLPAYKSVAAREAIEAKGDRHEQLQLALRRLRRGDFHVERSRSDST